MKIKDMQEICDQAQKNMGCINCKLFTPLLKNGCLKDHRYEISKKYQQAKIQRNEILAEKIMNDYKEIERKVIK